MAPDPRGFPGVASEVRLKSSASTPSLRSRNSEIVPMGRNTPENSGGNVKVVVRVRGFLPRETQRGAECLVEMNPQTQAVKLLAPNNTDPANAKTQSRKIVEEKNFTFDNSFWSHDKDDSHYAHQEDVYNALGEEFLDHNFEGYHTCIFAYGQTGSGKSYTMMGTPDQPGIIPRTCEDLFERIESNDSPNVSYSVRVSYFEVYNEHVRDLLAPPRAPNANGPSYLKIREDPITGPYVKDLTDVPVRNYHELLRFMRAGDASRTIASTKMNDTSSRSHAVFTITLKQIYYDIDTDSTTERLARIRLVDLAGSERAKATEAKGQRLREGANINKSLTTLGRVIAALADPRHARLHNGGKTRSKDVVPYRDSVLTWLLKDSLGGNSKTAMVACISPSDYDETLSTLRYADQAKHIRTQAVVNQDSHSSAERDNMIENMQNTIRDLQVQISRANQLANESQQTLLVSRMENDRMRDEKLDQYQRKVEEMQRLMEEEKLVSDSKLRQVVSQNETLKLHLSLALDRLKMKFPTEIPNEQAAMRRVSGVSNVSVGNNLGVKKGRVSFGVDSDKENEVESGYESDVKKRSVSINSAPDSEPVEDAEAEEEEDQGWDGDTITDIFGEYDDLLDHLNLYKRKIADDKTRFRFGTARQPLGEARYC